MRLSHSCIRRTHIVYPSPLPICGEVGRGLCKYAKLQASEILPGYADVLAETGTCLQEAEEDREFTRMRAAFAPLAEASLSLSRSFVVRSASPSVIVLLWREFRSSVVAFA